MGGIEGHRARKHICVGLLAHVDAGKTTLSEGILYETGVIRKPGRVDRRDAFLDTYDLERARGITIFSKQAVFALGDKEVTLLDTPGHVDFSPEMERTLQVLDYGVLVISGADGVQAHTETLWRLLARYGIPVFLFVNKMDQAGTDKEKLLEGLRSRLHENCIDFTGGREERQESLAMCDEEALEGYLARGSLTDEETAGLIAQRKAFPCYFGSALKLEGVDALLKGLEVYGEPPEYGRGFAARVYKISRDDQGNRLTHLKVTGGSLKVKTLLPSWQEGGPGEKVNQIRVYSGVRYEAVQEAEAGRVCAVTGLSDTFPGQRMGEEREAKLPFLEPILTYQMLLPDGCDVHKMLLNMRMLEEEEPQLHVDWNEAKGEILVQVMGEVQIQVLQSLIRERFGVETGFGDGSIVYKETIREAVEGVGHYEPLRHYAEVHLLLEPGERGSGLQFKTRCSEDVLDRNWQRLILTHLEEKRHRGVLTGAELTDVTITLIAGRAHQKHTEGGDFRQATYRAVRQGLMEAESILLEPCYRFRLEIPTEYTGRAMADIDRMCGRFEAPVQEGEVTVICGNASVAAMRNYQAEVVSYTRGRGRLACTLSGYEPCSDGGEAAKAAGYDPETDGDNPSGSVFCSHGAGYYVPWDQVKQHMHVESPLKLSARRELSSRRTDVTAAGAASYGDDKELEEIFTRTYGIDRRQRYGHQGPRRVEFESRSQPVRTREPEEEYLLVDGYNVIFAWEELKELAKTTIDGARHRLMDILCNYQGYKNCILILVFDAYKVEGGLGQAIRYHNIHVVYTKEAETADQYIEKLAHEMGKNHQVTVATSDGLEQLIIRGEGCRLMSAKDLRDEILYAAREMEAQHLEPLRQKAGQGKNYLFHYAEEKVAEYLEEMRLGKEQEEKAAQRTEESRNASRQERKS
ncbi:MAG: GTP-binding protein [Hungatella sp.]|nr:GTP-binding protein [Hungatella sp.]